MEHVKCEEVRLVRCEICEPEDDGIPFQQQELFTPKSLKLQAAFAVKKLLKLDPTKLPEDIKDRILLTS
jgi:hypothetical protein